MRTEAVGWTKTEFLLAASTRRIRGERREKRVAGITFGKGGELIA